MGEGLSFAKLARAALCVAVVMTLALFPLTLFMRLTRSENPRYRFGMG